VPAFRSRSSHPSGKHLDAVAYNGA
jgi:hypothetical protein